MNKVIYCPDTLPLKDSLWVFLMGPIQGAPLWHQEIESMPEIEGVTFLSPRRKENPVGSEDSLKVFSDEDYKEQVKWETLGLRACDIILCWIPDSVEDIPGRSYAQTTRFELGENLARGKFAIAGASPNIPGRRYFGEKLKSYLEVPLLSSLPECMETLKKYVGEIKKNKKIWFTSDNHFDSKRALEKSYRPFFSVDDMNERMIEIWNREVSPWDTIYCLGDFGDMNFVNLLNGFKILVMGNYEESEMARYDSREDYYDYLRLCGWDEVYEGVLALNCSSPKGLSLKKLVLSHFPSKVQGVAAGSGDNLDDFLENSFGLFGHIHGRQAIKRFGMDVGVDANHFSPVSIDKVIFYYKALGNNYYDDEVFTDIKK